MHALRWFLQTMMWLTLTTGAAAHAGLPSDAPWNFPEELLTFDETLYDTTIEQEHESEMPVLNQHTWAILGWQESEAHLNLGLYYYHQKQYDLAAAEYEKSLQLNPRDATAHYNLGILHFDLKQFDAAQQEYQAALQLDPGLSIAHNNLGTLHLIRKDYDQAEHAFQNAVRLNPEDLKARVNLGHIYFYVHKNFLAAKEHYQKALNLKPEIPLVRTNLDTIHQDQKEARSAEHQFEKSLENLDKKSKTPSPYMEIFGQESPTTPAPGSASGGLFDF